MFKKINFGKSAGEEERSEYPDLIIDGFYDFNNAIDNLVNKSAFLVQGFKGSGKSTIAEKICMTKIQNQPIFSDLIYLKDFSFSKFSKIYPGTEDELIKFPRTWRYILLGVILNNYKKNIEKTNTEWTNEVLEIDQSIKKLKDLGLLTSGNLNNLTTNASKKKFMVALPKIIEYSNEIESISDNDVNFDNVTEVFFDIASKIKKKTIIVIDGLDDVLINNPLQLNTLSSLIFEASNLNRKFKLDNTPVKICILIRVDLYERLPGGNKNKTSQDSNVLINWYNDSLDIEQTHLVKAADLRVKLSLGNKYNLKCFFDEYTNASKSQRNNKTLSYLIEYTRHTPRDFFQLLKSIQSHYNQVNESVKITDDEIFKGIREYSNGYFLPEIRDEISGYIENDIFESFLIAIAKIKQREFKFQNLLTHFQSEGNDINNLDMLLQVLFKCSAIGQKFDGDKYEYVYRNKYAKFDKSKTICLHRGLWKALNL
ncbi:hypothetical protein GKR50_13380 [Providencia rustigianii]|uniref:P-loop ATPase, Sll1717 family n=1 Tax=Providencia rustigianii TaxID=158850 RepID=UPI000F6CDE60|nr:hypothetical protein [Providencia rustigianii]MTC61002.1 hypothetical protein [Providencia rustigianii]VEH55417.1 Uncharacterised protein [Providencia rustigianii]